MASILVRDLDDGVVARLKNHARREGRSLQSEVRKVLEQAANAPRVNMATARRLLLGVRTRVARRLRGRRVPDSLTLLHEGRER